MLPLCRDIGVGVIPWSPLARGRLARPRSEQTATERGRTDDIARGLYDGFEASDGDVVDAVHQVAAERGVPAAQVALAWLLHKPGVTAPIVGATKVGHLEDAVAATGLALSTEEIERLEAPYRPHPVRGHA